MYEVPANSFARRELHALILRGTDLIPVTKNEAIRLALEQFTLAALNLVAATAELPPSSHPAACIALNPDGWLTQWLGNDVVLHEAPHGPLRFQIAQQVFSVPSRKGVIASDRFRLELGGTDDTTGDYSYGTRREIRKRLRQYLKLQGVPNAREIAARNLPAE